MNNEIHIAALVVHVLPETLDSVLDKTNQLPKVEYHCDDKEPKFVLLFEVESESALSSYMDMINNWNGVLSVRLCYHHCEPDESLNEEIQNATYTS